MTSHAFLYVRSVSEPPTWLLRSANGEMFHALLHKNFTHFHGISSEAGSFDFYLDRLVIQSRVLIISHYFDGESMSGVFSHFISSIYNE